MDAQTLINIGFGAAGALSIFVIQSIWNAVKDLQKADTALTTKVQEIEVLVAGNYVTNDKMEKMTSALFQKLDRIEMKLDGKADK